MLCVDIWFGSFSKTYFSGKTIINCLRKNNSEWSKPVTKKILKRILINQFVNEYSIFRTTKICQIMLILFYTSKEN